MIRRQWSPGSFLYCGDCSLPKFSRSRPKCALGGWVKNPTVRIVIAWTQLVHTWHAGHWRTTTTACLPGGYNFLGETMTVRSHEPQRAKAGFESGGLSNCPWWNDARCHFFPDIFMPDLVGIEEKAYCLLFITESVSKLLLKSELHLFLS